MSKPTEAVLFLRETGVEAWTDGIYVYVRINGLSLKISDEEIDRLSEMWNENN